MTQIECLRDIKDTRKARGIRHSSEEILIITLLGLISGRGTLSSIAEYSKSRWKDLKEEFHSNISHPRIGQHKQILKSLKPEGISGESDKLD